MKRFVFLVMMVAAVMFSLSTALCEAKDVWVDRWQNTNADIYVMDETLAWEENLNGKFFRVTTKEVQNGKVKRFIKWKYIKHGQEMWRYETNQMGGTHMTTVSPRRQVVCFLYEAHRLAVSHGRALVLLKPLF